MKFVLLATVFISILAVFSGSAQTAAVDSISPLFLNDTLPTAPDSLKDQTAAAKKRMPILKRSFNPKEQITFGIAMMAFFLFITTSAQTWNPD